MDFIRESKRPRDPTPALLIDFSRAVGSSKLKFDDFKNSTEMKPAVDFEVADEALVKRDRQPPQPLSDVLMKPHSSGQDNFIFTLGVVKYVDLLDAG